MVQAKMTVSACVVSLVVNCLSVFTFQNNQVE